MTFALISSLYGLQSDTFLAHRGSGRGIEMAEKLNIPWCKLILPQAPLYTMQGQEMQSWAELDPISA